MYCLWFVCSGSSLRNKQMFNFICELPETVARTLVPRMRVVKGTGKAINYLTPPRILLALVTAWLRRGRWFDDQVIFIPFLKCRIRICHITGQIFYYKYSSSVKVSSIQNIKKFPNFCHAIWLETVQGKHAHVYELIDTYCHAIWVKERFNSVKQVYEL